MKQLFIYRLYKIEKEKTGNVIRIPVSDSKGVIVAYYDIRIDEEAVSRFAGIPCPLALFIQEETAILEDWLMKRGDDMLPQSIEFFKEIIHDVGVGLETIFIWTE